MFGRKKTETNRYWINKNTNAIGMKVEKNIHNNLMMNKVII